MSSKIQFGDGFVDSDFVLMEVDDHILQCLQHDDEVAFKAEGREQAVLCTPDRTYSIKHADISNAFYLLSPNRDSPLEPMKFTKEETRIVVGNVKSYFELNQIPPKLEKLDRLLAQHTFKMGDDDSGTIDDEMESNNLHNITHSRDDSDEYARKKPKPASASISMNELMESVQASEEEIKAHLAIRCVVKEGDTYQLLDEAFLFTAQDNLLNAIALQDWDKSNLPIDAIATHMHDEYNYPNNVSLAIVKSLADGHRTDDGFTVWVLSEKKVARVKASELLLQASNPHRQWNLRSFMETWEACVPEGFLVKKEYLKGLGIIITGAGDDIIRYFPASSLPRNPRERFQVLFRAQQVWQLSNIAPYLLDIVSPLQTQDSLILKYARTYEGPGGERLLNAK
eukprot:m.34777 g.34777  ORF g.34777 m.34777 type:complete len:397 (+) comp6555_c0_seq1:189-1379(+)